MKEIGLKFILILLNAIALQFIDQSVFSQTPEKMSYQAVIRDSNGELVTNHLVGIEIRISQGSEFGATIFVERHIKMTDEYGLVALEVGGGTLFIGSFEIDWSSGPYFIKIGIDLNGGTNYHIYGYSQLLAVPYAMLAKKVENITETDPVYANSIANGITVKDTTNWNSKINSFNETDPIYNVSIAKGISAADTAYWNHKLSIETQNIGNVLSKGNNGGGMQIKNIANPTEALDAATKAYADVLLEQIYSLSKKLNSYNAAGTITDAEGNIYNTVKIGNQIWMSENLKTKKFNDSSDIPLVTDSKWAGLSTPAYCWYYNDETAYKNPYGALYNYYAVNTDRLCPSGWRVPNFYDWSDLLTYLGGKSIAGGKLKAIGNLYWNNPNTGADNSSGFFALPGGEKIYNWKGGGYEYRMMGNSGRWWSSTIHYGNLSWDLTLNYDSVSVNMGTIEWRTGNSVRCIKESDSVIIHLPMVLTDSVLSVSDSSAVIGGVVVADGGSTIISKGICWDTIPNPDTTNHVILSTNTINRFKINFAGLSPDKKYYVRAFALNEAGVGYGKAFNFHTLPGKDYVGDIVGNFYKTVKIGNQTWMAENLKTISYNDGSLIPYAKYGYNSGYRWYNNDSIKYYNTYGVLYNTSLTATGKLCPTGWHVPGDAEWETLADILGGMEIAGGKLKESDTTHWSSPNTGATNESGFNALPGGYFYYREGGHGGSYSAYTGLGTEGYWLSSGQNYYSLGSTKESIQKNTSYYGISANVRCKMDDDLSSASVPTLTTSEISNILQRTANGGGTVLSDGGSIVTKRGICWSTSHNPDTNNAHTLDGYATGKFTSFINNLSVNTNYYVRAYAINAVGVGYGNELTFRTLEEHDFGTVTDIDGNTYKTILIGNQTWMAENLKTTRFRNGDTIPCVYDPAKWKNLSTAAYCNYNNAADTNKTYGRLYNYFAILDTSNVCPSGWYVPTEADWTTLIDKLGDASIAGIKLVEAGTLHWPKNNKATNETGFTALPGGYRTSYSSYYEIGSFGMWWSRSNNLYSWYASNNRFYKSQTNSKYGLSVRCIKEADLSTTVKPTVKTDSITEIYQNIATSGGSIISDGQSTIQEKGICWSTDPTPDTSDYKINIGFATAPFKGLLKNLTPQTTYYVRAYAINAKGIGYGNEQIFTTAEELPYGSVTDIEGNVYKTIKIGNQTWMAENLKTKKYSNGDTIGTTIPGTKSINLENEPKYQWASMNDTGKVKVYGRLYTWYVANDSRNVCPTGWHVPNDTSWAVLIDYLGGASIAGGKLKEARTEYFDWNSSSKGATNESGFSALPTGYRYYNGSFYNYNTFWWSANPYDSTYAKYTYLSTTSSGVFQSFDSKKYGISIRCIKK